MAPEVSPWRTEQGRLARHNQMVLLARGKGDLADFARDVLSGRAKPKDLLYSSYLSDETLESVRAGIDAWHALPETEQQAAIVAADTQIRAEIAGLAALDLSDRPPEPEADDDDDDYDFGAGFLDSLP